MTSAAADDPSASVAAATALSTSTTACPPATMLSVENSDQPGGRISSVSVPCTDPVGDFPGRVAPDASWFLRDRPWPKVGEMVEVCFARRVRPGEVEPPLVFGLAALSEHDAEGSSEWKLPDGQTLLFNPDFWRPRQSSE